MRKETPPGRILVVEDDASGRELVVRALEMEGHEVRSASTAALARSLLARLDLDLVVLDLGLPDADGLEILQPLANKGGPPVLVLSGRDSLGDRVLGLDAGADDYLTKPVAIPELQARVRALLRRGDDARQVVSFGPLEIELDAREARLDGVPLDLTRREFQLLALLATNPRKVFTREDLLRQIWRSAPEYQVDTTVTEHIRRLRRKLDDDPAHPQWIVTIRGVGYRFGPSGEPA